MIIFIEFQRGPTMKNKKVLSSYDEHVQSLSKAKRKKFEEGYRDLLLSELLIALMKEDEISVRELAKAAGISPTIIQGVRSGAQQNLTMQSFFKILKALHCSITIETGKSRYPFDLSVN